MGVYRHRPFYTKLSTSTRQIFSHNIITLIAVVNDKVLFVTKMLNIFLLVMTSVSLSQKEKTQHVLCTEAARGQ